MEAPPSVQAVLKTPGYYRFNNTEYYWFFEVDEHERVYQLNPHTGKRDGLLSRNGWNESSLKGSVQSVTREEIKKTMSIDVFTDGSEPLEKPPECPHDPKQHEVGYGFAGGGGLGGYTWCPLCERVIDKFLDLEGADE